MRRYADGHGLDLPVIDLTARDAPDGAPLDNAAFEDEFVELAFGLGTVRRRHRRDALWRRPVTWVTAVALAFMLGAVVGSRTHGPHPPPSLPAVSGRLPFTIVTAGASGLTSLDLWHRTISTTPSPTPGPGAVQAGVATRHGLVLLSGPDAWFESFGAEGARGPARSDAFSSSPTATDMGPADALVPAADGALLLRWPAAGATLAQLVDANGAARGGPLHLTHGEVVLGAPAGRILVQLAPDPANRRPLELLAYPRGTPVARLAPDAVFLAVGGNEIAWRPIACGTRCPVYVTDARTSARRIAVVVDGRAVTPLTGTIAPNGRTLVVFRTHTNGSPADALVIDLRRGTRHPARLAGAVPGVGDAAWSPDGSLLVAAVGPDALIVDRGGRTRRVPTPLPEYETLLTRP